VPSRAIDPTQDPLLAQERILRATIEALAQLDPGALTIQQICRAAEVKAPTLYYHFGNKDGLISAAVDRLASDWLDALDAIIPRHGNFEETIALVQDGWAAMLRAPARPVIVFVWVTLLAGGSSEQARTSLIRARDRGLVIAREALVPHFGDTDLTEALASLVVDSLIAAALNYQLDRDDDALDRRLAALATVVRAADVARRTVSIR